MALRYGLRTASDRFAKLRRDAALLDEEVTSDLFFNFVVTARHLPEWIEKDPDFRMPRGRDLTEVTGSDLYGACRDIADASKHFDLRPNRGKASTVFAVESVQGYGVGRYGTGGYGLGEEAIAISLRSGESIDSLEFCQRVIDLFLPFFSPA